MCPVNLNLTGARLSVRKSFVMTIGHTCDSAVCIGICALGGVDGGKSFYDFRLLRLDWLFVALWTACQPFRHSCPSRTIALPTSKELAEPVPGGPQRLNSLPMTAAISPDGRYLAVVNAGYGTFESLYQQSIAVLDIQTGKVTDFPEPRTRLVCHRRSIPGWPSAKMARICMRSSIR